MQPTSPVAQVDWTNLVSRVQRGQRSGIEGLRQIFAKGIRFFIRRQYGSQELEDNVDTILSIVIRAIQHGHLENPEQLAGLVLATVRRNFGCSSDHAIYESRDNVMMEIGYREPDRRSVFTYNVELMKVALGELSERDRETLIRFYLRVQTLKEICEAMNVTEAEFWLLESRTSARFAELKQKTLNRCKLKFTMLGTLDDYAR